MSRQQPAGTQRAVVSQSEAERLERLLEGGGVCVFPTDTVYGVGCSPYSSRAISRVYELKGRPPEKPAAVMFFSLTQALGALADLSERERKAMQVLLPGPLTLLLPNRGRRFLGACGPDPATLGVRVPRLAPPIAALALVRHPVLQSSANLAGGPEARRLEDVPGALAQGADLVIDGGELPGIASTVLDLREYEQQGRCGVVREGALAEPELTRLLGLLA
jgi:L-threonylcarbamoyladenylate synthase